LLETMGHFSLRSEPINATPDIAETAVFVPTVGLHSQNS